MMRQAKRPLFPHEDSGLPGPLQDSWQRSQDYGLHRDDDLQPWVAPSFLQDAHERNLWARQLATPLLDHLSAELKKHPSIMVLADATGLVLTTRGDTRFLNKAEHLALSPGHLWSENARGTNAIGTALALGSRCEVSGQEHFLNRNAGLFCSAAPVFRPDGLLAGVVDMSTPAVAPRIDAAALVQRTVRQMEHAWVASGVREHRWLLRLHPDARVLGSHHELILLFEDNVLLGANKLAVDELRLQAAHFGSLTLETLFPALSDRPEIQRSQAYNARDYYVSRTAPPRRLHGRGVEPVPQAPGLDKQKALRILNAGIAVCVTGETGCGKEYFSRELYQQSRWRSGKFVAVNCAAIPENLIESELFGYLPGAFTGASAKGYTGKIREADGGILFLDEIGDMPATMQTRLLRVLQEKTVTPLGGNTAQPVDFALICATHQDLFARVQEGAFREDLFYRIREFNLTIAPLREWSHRQIFIRQLWRSAGGDKRAITLSEPLVEHLAALPWPGNVRQLVSLLKVLMALADDGDTVTPADLPAEYLTVSPQTLSAEDRAIRSASGNMSLAAKTLGISRSTLYRRLERDKHQA
ncbi:sigma-54-dependent Fis family transcriptional regulator [[Enterobacter] lignolyticus]|uniref:GAF modulated sigma54 specific transcriptional regulator, Fis family n=1 Tax=Enterobacter lignolyticus (strain SCF1) TaxID=701347 RepID=E3GD08_ENTLS|nr:sigma-54-dependent Fis family transcriptional regulator [[Enterobacter] lignolyticus]ADO49027.1 GAF modulated sigma54 specific transcriptional regulator, Fis family [[Enterobacter] lignolyticus SCF1]